MWILLALLLIAAALWLAGVWFGRSVSLAVFDQPLESDGSLSFSAPEGPSPEHREAVAGILALGSQVKG